MPRKKPCIQWRPACSTGTTSAAGYAVLLPKAPVHEQETRSRPRPVSGPAYIHRHQEITDVLLTGGNLLFLPTPRLEKIVRKVREILHVDIIRMGTEMPAYNPFRIINDSPAPQHDPDVQLGEKADIHPDAVQPSKRADRRGDQSDRSAPEGRGEHGKPDAAAPRHRR